MIERRLRAASLDYIREHPGYVATVLYWNTRRLLDLGVLALVAPHGVDDQRRAAMGRPRRRLLLDRGVLALVGFIRRRNGVVVGLGMPLVMYLSVMFTGRRDAALPARRSTRSSSCSRRSR